MHRGRFFCLVVLCLVSIALLPSRHAADWVSPTVAFAQEKTNTYYAAQFPGPDKFTKIANAQNSCTVPISFNMNCVIVVDAILAGWPAGTSINPCNTCIWMDYTTPGGLTIVQSNSSATNLHLQINTGSDDGSLSAGVVTASIKVVSPNFIGQTAGTASLGTVFVPFGSVVVGSALHRSSTLSMPASTADRTTTLPDGNSATVLIASLTTTAATTDNVSIQGMTSSGHCTLTATNSAAAAGIASVFVSAKASNQITVTHTATAGWTFDIACTSI